MPEPITLQLTGGFVSLPCEALVTNLTFEEIGAIATFKGAVEAMLNDPKMIEPMSVELDTRLKDERLLKVIRSLRERGIFHAITESNKVTLSFDLTKA